MRSLDGLEACLRELWSIQPDDLHPIAIPRLVIQLRDSISQWRGSGVHEAHLLGAAEVQSARVLWLLDRH